MAATPPEFEATSVVVANFALAIMESPAWPSRAGLSPLPCEDRKDHSYFYR